MGYGAIRERLQAGDIVLLDGGTGTELQRRGVRMDPGAWCGPASLESGDVLERARRAGRSDVLVGGSLSHMAPFVAGSAQPDTARSPSAAAMAGAYTELAGFLCDSGCDLILLEMMYYPERIGPAFEAALATGLPVWAGFSARRAEDGQLLSGLSPEHIDALRPLRYARS